MVPFIDLINHSNDAFTQHCTMNVEYEKGEHPEDYIPKHNHIDMKIIDKIPSELRPNPSNIPKRVDDRLINFLSKRSNLS